MLESIVANALKAFLTDFIEIEGSDGRDLQEKVHIGAWKGDIVLEDVVLKKHLFSQTLGVPISLSYGVIGRLVVHIPWAHLGVEPVVVVVERVYLLLEPKYTWDQDAYRKREQMAKKAELAAAELFIKRRSTKDGPLHRYSDMAKKWLIDSLIAKAVNNLQVTVRDVHIRYEDHVSVDKSPFCFGFTMDSLHVSTGEFQKPVEASGAGAAAIDENFGMQFGGADSFRKLIEVSHSAFYWNPLQTAASGGGGSSLSELCRTSFKNRARPEIQSLMRRSIARPQSKPLDRPLHHYILHPTNVSVRLDVLLDASVGGAKVCARCSIPDLTVVFEDHHYKEIPLLIANMLNFMKLERFSGARPLKAIGECLPAPEVTDSGEAAEAKRAELRAVVRSWWRYAAHAEIHKLNNPSYLTCT